MLTKDLVAQFNVVARTEYNKKYQEFEPKFKELLYEYQSGPVASVDFPFFGFLQGMEKFTGSRTHQLFPEGHKFTVTNEEWDMAVDIPIKDIERAAAAGSLAGLNPYQMRISEMPIMVKDHPVELAFDMLEVGDAATYGTCMDGQNFFDTTHNYSNAAGTQNNIVTGTGTTTGAIHTDLLSVIAQFQTFFYMVGGNNTNSPTAKQRKLNRTMDKLLIVAPLALHGSLYELQTSTYISTTSGVIRENALKGRFDFITLPFTDTGDWYAVLLDDPIFKPFLYQVEKEPVLDMPSERDTEARERKIFTYGAYGRYNVAYGAWWKAIMVTNT